MRVLEIFGDGIAGLTAGRILCALGHAVRIVPAKSPAPRRVALSGTALFLLERIWGGDLLQGLASHMLNRRILAWNSPEPAVLDEQAMVVDISDLAARMKTALRSNTHVAWTDECHNPLLVAAPFDGSDRYLTGGGRQAAQASADLCAGADSAALHVEAVAGGWLVVMPIGKDKATVMGVAAGEQVCLAALLAQSRQAMRIVSHLEPQLPPAGSMPRLRLPSDDPAMRIGDSAMRFDPISGDGVAGALRGAHLGALLLDRGPQSSSGPALHRIYEQRLAQAMRAHLRGLNSLYADAPFAQAWAPELRAHAAMDAAIAKAWPAGRPAIAIAQNTLTMA
jgi:hypothetical protein